MILCLWPVITFAAKIGTGTLSIDASSPDQAMLLPGWGWIDVRTDYDATYTINGHQYSSEAYCAQATISPSGTEPYDFWAIDDNLNGKTEIHYDRYIAATWLAQWGFDKTDKDKGIAQIAIWEVLFESGDNYDLFTGDVQSYDYWWEEQLASSANYLLKNDFKAALENGTYDDYTSLWLLAVNPINQEQIDPRDPKIDPLKKYQNYLVRNPNPVPIPGALWVFGMGLIGIRRIVKRFS